MQTCMADQHRKQYTAGYKELRGTHEREKRQPRTYPPFYERFIPAAIGLLVILIIGMLVFTVAVGTGLLRFG